MGCQLSKNRQNNSVEVNVGGLKLLTKHKDITRWERNDYKKRMNKKESNNIITRLSL